MKSLLLLLVSCLSLNAQTEIKLTNNAARINFYGKPDTVYGIETSESVNGPWSLLSALVSETNGYCAYADTNTDKFNCRFYRPCCPIVLGNVDADTVWSELSEGFIGDDQLYYASGGHTFKVRIYAYKNIAVCGLNTRVYSERYAEAEAYDGNIGTSYLIYITWHWAPVSGADGYRVLKGGDSEINGGFGEGHYNFDFGCDVPAAQITNGWPFLVDWIPAWNTNTINVLPHVP